MRGEVPSTGSRLARRCILLWIGIVELAEASAQTVGIIFEPQLGVAEDLVGGLNSLKFGDEVRFLAGVSIRVIL